MTPPILFLVFNRPDTTLRVFEAIRAARPKRLYVAADGPRSDRPRELELCAQVRRVATAVDWPCDLKVLFRDENLGCGRAVFGAISWFFDNEPEGIILEDDTLPDATFFTYCSELLARYREDTRVMSICGSGYGDAHRFGRSSYTFSRVFDPWGWASWRRAWQLHDGSLRGFEQCMRVLGNVGPRGFDCSAYWSREFTNTANGAIDTWDYPWMFSIFKMRGLVVYPATNLISNLGFRCDATHTLPPEGGQTSLLSEMPLVPLPFPMSHPFRVRHNLGFEVDLYTRRLRQTRRSHYSSLYHAMRKRISLHIPEPVKARLRAWRASRLNAAR
jgi:hypothetical protein